MKINTTDIQPDWAWLEDLLSGLQDAWNEGDTDEIECALMEFDGLANEIIRGLRDVLKRNGVKSG